MKTLFLYIFLFLCVHGFSQDYNYIHYDTREGLPSSTVYRICQDKKGYLWFATDNGLSRFDGKVFKNFTTKDGLTDNEVLSVSADSKDRIWILSFNKTICYYYNGKIYNSTNDSTLRHANFNSNLVTTGENSRKEPCFLGNDGVYCYTNNNSIKRIADFSKIAARYSVDPTEFLIIDAINVKPPRMLLYNKNLVFHEVNDEFVFLKKIKSSIPDFTYIRKIEDDLEISLFRHVPSANLTTRYSVDPDLFIYNTMDGAWFMDSIGIKNVNPALRGKKVSHSLRDSEGNLWFTTLGEGIYRVTSTDVKTFLPGEEFLSLEKQNGIIFAGMNKGDLQMVKGPAISRYNYRKKPNKSTAPPRLYTMKSDNKGSLYLGFDSHLMKYSKNDELSTRLSPIKSIDIVDNNHIVVCTNFCVLKLRSKDLTVVDTIWKERGTKVLFNKGLYYIGTLNGLMITDTNKNIITSRKDTAYLINRIADMCITPNGSLWIATADNGIFIYTNGKVQAVINTINGLNSNNCRTLFQNKNCVWVGSDEGINKIDITTRKVTGYGITHGLSSNRVNAIYENNDTVWVATPKGLTFFDEKLITDSSICKLDMHVSISGEPASFSFDTTLGYRDNNISFDYTAISFKSAGEITYRYRLIGLDTNWQTTDLNTVSYPSLPSGDYAFMLYAINKLGKESDIVRIEFTIATPFWKTVWFWLTIAVVLFLLSWFFLNKRYKFLQQKENEKNKLAARITELEQLSLRAQINPHFIFNCLTSIQSFILNNDMESANLYIGQFGSLMRQTLDNSSQPYISINRELNYLESYLKLEQMRFPSKFRFEINIDKNIQTDYVLVPSLFLQPFAENAIRHGIRHKKEAGGIIKIDVKQKDERVVFILEDNGIGRQAASKYKTVRHIEYQSKGIKLTLDRLNILSTENDEKTEVEIVDLFDNENNPAGTKVIISFPLSIIQKLN